jgi:hypothetical protein
MVPSSPDRLLPTTGTASRALRAVWSDERVAGYLFAAYALALVAGLFVAPVVLTVGLGVETFRAVELTILAIGAGYAIGMIAVWTV